MESYTHNKLVKKIYNYIQTYKKVKKDLIECDIFEVKGKVTRMLEGFIPDVYYDYNNLTIIGEAKSENDLERIHSIKQYKSYIHHLQKKIDNGNEGILIIAVPWQASVSAYRIIKRLIINNSKIKIIVMNEVGVYKEYEKGKFNK